MKINTIEELAAVIKLATDNQLDVLQLGDVIISKSRHISPIQIETSKPDDEDLFYSAQ